MNYAELEKRLGYTFKNPKLLVQALTHPSASTNSQTRIAYERLEFLGDAVLELAVSYALYQEIPDQPEGVLTHMRSRIVSRQHFYQMALQLDIGQFIILGKGEELSGGRQRLSNLSNTFEAIFGAIILDSDYETARAVALRILSNAIHSVATDLKENNPKGELQSVLQGFYPESPVYHTEELADHSQEEGPRFVSTVQWRGVSIGSGTGASKRKAEVAAANDALSQKIWLNHQFGS